ncbi:putative bifunctional diguanylate cyclase/phosphodiesterase [Rhizobium sp. SGZ-381]|uniref:putative bifunctional diguanylate cyclase/phosphodiesterase n=1 Tax=Rhizobium sp. SGZ-381 TaxID=3342800 RepID=UPI00366F6934
MLPAYGNRAKWELLVWLAAFLIIYGLALWFDGHEALDALFRSHEEYDLDEVFTALNVAGSLGLIYSILRIKDMSKEIQRRLAAEEHVDWIACHDPLTELPNRRFLESVVSRGSSLAVGAKYAVYSIDLDGFKKINDLLGHEKGDLALKVIAQRLLGLFADDKVFRLGGDEFIVVIERNNNPELTTLGRRVVSAICKPILIEGASIELGASVGFARVPEDCESLREAIRYSDSAMYAAKKAGRNCVQGFRPEMQEELVRKLRMEADLKVAMKRNEIRPFYQPLVDLRTREIIGYEALARWERETGEFVPPSEFIPLAENAGLIVQLTDQLFRIACRDALGWPAHTILSFNLSPLQLNDRLLRLRIIKVLEEVGLPVHRLELEVTEGALIADPETARDVLNELSQEGIKIALDDFGTGFSSLSQLSNYPFDKIKIDKSFVATFEESNKQGKVVRAIISLGSGLGVKITAEGIEEEGQLRLLQDLGCDIGQGFLLGRPQPVDQTIKASQTGDPMAGTALRRI